MSESYLSLSASDRTEALETAADKSGRPSHLLEKDVWVVWTLSVLYNSPFRNQLTFKGGTSLSKAYHAIDRFSEDVDLTYDIRLLLSDLQIPKNGLPASRSQADKWTDKVRARLPGWINDNVIPLLQNALRRDHLDAEITIEGGNLLIDYDPLKRGTDYVRASVTLEFGARSTGEPHQNMPITCEMAPHLPMLCFPLAQPLVMAIGRTFWEKATAAHVYCEQGRLRADRFARHWYDLTIISRSPHFADILGNRSLATDVANHKNMFFRENDRHGQRIDYVAATSGNLNIVPEDSAYVALEDDYRLMIQAGLLPEDNTPSFSEIMAACGELEKAANSGKS